MQDFLRWWAGELLSFLPARDDRVLLARKKGLEVRIRREGVSVYRKADLRQPLSSAQLAAENVALATCLSGLGRQRRVRVTLDKSLCFFRQSRLPLAARHRAGQVLSLELNQVMPFAMGDIASGWFASAAPSAGFQDYVQVAVKREDIANAVKLLQAQGARMEGLAVREGDNAALPLVFNANGMSLAGRLADRWRRRFSLSFATLAVVSAAAMGALAWKASATADDIASATDDVSGKVKTVRTGIEAYRAANGQLQTILNLRENRMQVAGFWSEMARLLPDSAWVQSLSIKGTEINLEGDAMDAEQLIGILDKSDRFRNVRFSAPVYLDPASQQFHFAIAMDIERPAQ